MQDAAYQSLLKSRRRPNHARIVGVLEQRFPDVVATQPEVMARHCVEARLIEKAITYWHKAGRQAMARSAMAEAEGPLEAGIADCWAICPMR